jgi:hypothetical protein
MFDIIGDIHGHADKLLLLLERLGYSKMNGSYSHSERKAIFVGDYIDRGPKIPETINLVRDMVENNAAIALMGNHEYNAICFHYPEREKGGHLRKHEIKYILQHYETLKQFQNRQAAYDDALKWFETLPLFYEHELFRVVHACWDQEHINHLKKLLNGVTLDEHTLLKLVKKGTNHYNAIEETLKGKEMSMPQGSTFTDKDGNVRSEFRCKWWVDPSSVTYNDISIEDLNLPSIPIKSNTDVQGSVYDTSQPLVFFGHYWLKGRPGIFRENICCVDYSVAKGGVLAAYRYDGEKVLSNDKWVYV